MSTRDHNTEFQDNAERQYAYEFDLTVREYLLRRVAHTMLPNGPTLELGAFKGDMTEQLLTYYDQIDVVEGSSILAAEVRERFGERVNVTTSLFEDFVPDKPYQNIFLVHALEHLDDPVSELRRIGSWMAEGGNLLAAVPNANALSRQIAVHMGLIPYGAAVTAGEREHGHRRTYSLDTLLAAVREAGLSVNSFGGVIVKPLANFQLDQAMAQGIITEEFIKGCESLSHVFPDLASSIYVVCGRLQNPDAGSER